MRIAYKTAVTLTKPQHLSFLCIFSFNIDGWGGGDRHLCRSQNDYAGRLGVAPTYLAHICLFEKKKRGGKPAPLLYHLIVAQIPQL